MVAGTPFSPFLIPSAQHRLLDRHLMHLTSSGVDKGRGLGIRVFQEEGPVCAKAQWCDLSGAMAV